MPSNAHFARSLTSGALAGLVACTAVGNMQHSSCIVKSALGLWLLKLLSSLLSSALNNCSSIHRCFLQPHLGSSNTHLCAQFVLTALCPVADFTNNLIKGLLLRMLVLCSLKVSYISSHAGLPSGPSAHSSSSTDTRQLLPRYLPHHAAHCSRRGGSRAVQRSGGDTATGGVGMADGRLRNWFSDCNAVQFDLLAKNACSALR